LNLQAFPDKISAEKIAATVDLTFDLVH
jgi:hypothetical protein